MIPGTSEDLFALCQWFGTFEYRIVFFRVRSSPADILNFLRNSVNCSIWLSLCYGSTLMFSKLIFFMTVKRALSFSLVSELKTAWCLQISLSQAIAAPTQGFPSMIVSIVSWSGSSISSGSTILSSSPSNLLVSAILRFEGFDASPSCSDLSVKVPQLCKIFYILIVRLTGACRAGRNADRCVPGLLSRMGFTRGSSILQWIMHFDSWIHQCLLRGESGCLMRTWFGFVQGSQWKPLGVDFESMQLQLEQQEHRP